MAEFEPRELDLLEDALDGLEEAEDIGSLELSEALSERLGEYQDVLALCREAFPLEEPAETLLDEVIAEAHTVSRRPKLPEVGEASGAWRRFWERWRGTLIPGFALAGTAAAVLWLLEPEDALGPEADKHAELSDHKSEDKDTPTKSEAASKSDTRKQLEPRVDDNDEDKDKDASADELEAPEDQGGEPAVSKPNKASKKTRLGGGDDAPAPAIAPDEPAPEPLDKDSAYSLISDAHAARLSGDCVTARTLYDKVIRQSKHAQIIARAKAGIGLCLEQRNRDGEAESWFEEARAESPGVDAWIEGQRDEQPLPSEKKKRSKAKSKKSAPAEAFEDAL